MGALSDLVPGGCQKPARRGCRVATRCDATCLESSLTLKVWRLDEGPSYFQREGCALVNAGLENRSRPYIWMAALKEAWRPNLWPDGLVVKP